MLAGVVSQRGEWVASRSGEIAIREQPVTLESTGEADVLLFPGDRLGDLVDAGRLAQVPNDAVMPPTTRDGLPTETNRPPVDEAKAAKDPFDYMDIATPFRDQVTRYGNERMALPYGGSALVLVYRRDAFESDANRAAAAEKGLKLEPPKTWGELDALARFFQGRDWDGDGRPDHGISLVLGADAEGLGDATFLARAASLGQHPDQFSFLFDSGKLAPRIDTPPFVEALGALVALKAAGPPGMERFDADAAREAFRTGKVALLIDRAERAAAWSPGKPGRRRAAAGLGTGLRPQLQDVGHPAAGATRRAICPTAAAGSSASVAALPAPGSTPRSTWRSTWPTRRARTAPAPSGLSRCCRSAPRRWARGCPTRPRRPTSTRGSGPRPSAGRSPNGPRSDCGSRRP